MSYSTVSSGSTSTSRPVWIRIPQGKVFKHVKLAYCVFLVILQSTALPIVNGQDAGPRCDTKPPLKSELFICYLFIYLTQRPTLTSIVIEYMYAYLVPYSTFRCWIVLFRYLTCLSSQNSFHVTNCTPW